MMADYQILENKIWQLSTQTRAHSPPAMWARGLQGLFFIQLLAF